MNIRPIVRGQSGRVQAPDCGAPASPSDLAAGLNYLSLGQDGAQVLTRSAPGNQRGMAVSAFTSALGRGESGGLAMPGWGVALCA